MKRATIRLTMSNDSSTADRLPRKGSTLPAISLRTRHYSFAPDETRRSRRRRKENDHPTKIKPQRLVIDYSTIRLSDHRLSDIRLSDYQTLSDIRLSISTIRYQTLRAIGLAEQTIRLSDPQTLTISHQTIRLFDFQTIRPSDNSTIRPSDIDYQISNQETKYATNLRAAP